MDYQYLYGSVQEFYRSVSVSDAVPDSWRQRISGQCERFLRYGRDGGPHNYTWMLQGGESEKKWVFSCCGEKLQAHAPSYFMHAHLRGCGPEDLLKNFDGLLKTAFYSERQFDALAAGQSAAAPEHHWGGSDEYLDIPRQTLRAVVYGIVNRWRVSAQPVVVAVPASENYDSYTYRAVRTIYSCLPAALRACAGFMTYAKPDEKLSQIALFFVPEDVAPENAVRLDGSGADPRPLLECSLSAAFKELLDALIDSPDRETLLQNLLQDVEIPRGMETLRGADYVNYHLQRNLLTADAADPEIFRQWITIAGKPASCPEALRAELLRSVDRCLAPQTLLTHVAPLWSGAATPLAKAESIREVFPLCACSGALAAPVEAQLMQDLGASLARADSLQAVHTVLIQLQGILDLSKNVIPGAAAAEEFRIQSGNRQIDLIQAMHAASKAALDTLKAQNADPVAFYQAALVHLETFRKDLEGDWQDNVQHACRGAYDSMRGLCQKAVLDAFREAVSVRPPEGPATSAYYEGELARLQALRSRLPADEILQDISLQLEGAIRDLTARFETSNVRRDEQLQKVSDLGSDYFRGLSQLQRAEAVSAADKADMVSGRLRHYRPASYDAYLDLFRQTYGTPLSLAALSGLGQFERETILQDMDSLLSVSFELSLTGCTWSRLVLILTHKKAYSELFSRKSDPSVTLRWGNEIFRMECGPLLDIVTALDSEGRGENLPENPVEKLCVLLRQAGVLTDEKLPTVMGFLLRSNLASAATALAEEAMMKKRQSPPDLTCRCRIYDLLQQIDTPASQSVVRLLEKNRQWPREADGFIGFLNSVDGEEAPKKASGKKAGAITLPLWSVFAAALVVIALAAALILSLASGSKEPADNTTAVTTSATGEASQTTTGPASQTPGSSASGPKVNID